MNPVDRNRKLEFLQWHQSMF